MNQFLEYALQTDKWTNGTEPKSQETFANVGVKKRKINE